MNILLVVCLGISIVLQVISLIRSFISVYHNCDNCNDKRNEGQEKR